MTDSREPSDEQRRTDFEREENLDMETIVEDAEQLFRQKPKGGEPELLEPDAPPETED